MAQKNINRRNVEERLTVLLVLAWLLLMGGRWLITPLLMYGDPSLSRRFALWDQGGLLYTYVALAIITLVIVGLRAVRKQGSHAEDDACGENGRQASDHLAPENGSS